MQYYYQNQDEYNKAMYKKSLRKDTNKLGGLLIAFFAFLTIFSLIDALVLAFTKVDSDIDSYMIFVSDGLISMIVFFIVGIIYAAINKLNFSEIFPFEKIKSSALIKLCIVAFGLCMVSNLASDMLTDIFSVFGVDNSIDMEFDVSAPYSKVLYFIVVALTPALVEEFAFRGIIMGTLRRYSDPLAVLISAALFGIMHGNFVQIPFAFCVGLVLGFVDVKTNSLLPSIIIHFLNNGFSVLFSVLYTSGILDDELFNYIDALTMIVLLGVSIILFASLIKKNKELFSFEKKTEVIPFRESVKTVCTSPTMIIFVCFCMLEALLMLFTVQ